MALVSGTTVGRVPMIEISGHGRCSAAVSVCRFALELFGRDQHFSRHAGNVGALGIVQAYFEDDGADVALAAAHIALGGKVGFGVI